MSETSRPLVTVVVPVYNKADSVIRTLESVQKQTLSNFECFVINNNSTDNSKEIILDFIKDDRRFIYLNCEKQGVAHARNMGVFAGDAPFICCLDSDDAIDENFLEVCVSELENDATLGIAYTGLWYIKPNGEQGLSTWPGEFSYDEQLQGQNQIPTCNVSRREIWERTGGQRQRYAPDGCGEEDAEFWLRAGSLGWDAKKVTDAGFFIYSWLSGLVSGDRTHKVTDWRAWHPWTKDNHHPFASMATPRRYSHLVRQYDQPIISVVIPVGGNHKEDVEVALDSLEAQTFRKWEVIIVDDTDDVGDPSWLTKLHTVYPYIKTIKSKSTGAGAARNTGVSIARADLLLFLDADDWLNFDALENLFTVYNAERAIIYSDYIGKAFIDEHTAITQFKSRLLSYDQKTGEATLHHNSSDYDCNKAVIQPYPDVDGNPYNWCLITALLPKSWHNEIGGFDEKMPSWEDWDYWIRMAKAGKCFIRINKELVAYRFYSGGRRDSGLQQATSLIQYLENKYRSIKIMPCSCKDKNTVSPTMPNRQESRMLNQPNQVQDAQMVLCLYTSLNVGDHRIIGAMTGTNYGYRGGGTKFLVDSRDIAAQPDLFRPITTEPDELEKESKDKDVSIPAPSLVQEAYSDEKEALPAEQTQPPPQKEEVYSDEDDFQLIPGISAIHAQMLNAAGVNTFGELVDFGSENLKQLKGIGDKRADAVIEFAKKKVAGEL